jgi:hypothetical protein
MWPSRSARSRTDRGRWGERSAPRAALRPRVSLLLTWRTSVLLWRTPVRNQFLGVHRGSRICASFVLPSRGVPLPFTTARRGGIRALAGAASRLLTLRRASTGTADGCPDPCGRGGRHAFWPSVAPHLPRSSTGLGRRYFFSPSPLAATRALIGAARFVNSVGMMNFVEGDAPSCFSASKY